MPASPAAALPLVTFVDSVSFHVNGDDVDAFHVPPAHTDGDAIVYFRKANVLHMGDTFFNGLYPFVDLSTGGFSCLLAKAPPVGDEVGFSLRLPAAEALAGRARDQDVKVLPGNVRVSFQFVGQAEADRERLETFVFDTVLAAAAGLRRDARGFPAPGASTRSRSRRRCGGYDLFFGFTRSKSTSSWTDQSQSVPKFVR